MCILAACKHQSERTHTLTWRSVSQAASAPPAPSANTYTISALLAVLGAYTYTQVTTLADIILSVVEPLKNAYVTTLADISVSVFGSLNYTYTTTLSDITRYICREAHHIAAGSPMYRTVLAAPWRSDRCQSHAPPA